MVPPHWAGAPYGPQEHEASLTRITPGMPARLDVAFALPPPGQERAGIERAITSGQISMSVTSFDREKAESSWGIPSRQRQEPQRPKRPGCWLAQPVALYNPDRRLPAYLSPGGYRVRVEVGCSGGEGDGAEFVLSSPQSWEGLALRRPKQQFGATVWLSRAGSLPTRQLPLQREAEGCNCVTLVTTNG